MKELCSSLVADGDSHVLRLGYIRWNIYCHPNKGSIAGIALDHLGHLRSSSVKTCQYHREVLAVIIDRLSM